MDAQLLVIIAGLVLVAVVIISLVALRGYSGKFRFDTENGTAPRASEGEGNTPKVMFKGRFTGLIAGVGAAFALIVAKLWSMQMVSSDYYEQLAEENRTRTITTPADRGRILDRNGVVLVGNRPSLVVTAYSSLADDEVAVRHLANLLGLPYTAVRRNIQDNSEGAQSAHTVATDVSRRVVAYIQEHASEFDGVEIAQRSERQYPYRTLAAQLLGYTGTATSEQLNADTTDDPGAIAYESGDVVGQAGVELTYERVLQGIRGEQTVRVDANGNVTGQSAAVEAQPGSDIKLTIDLAIQQACESGLEKAFEAARQQGYENAGAGSCVCIDCKTGEILGMANAPSYDPSSFVGGISQDVWDQLNDEANKYPLMNRAIAGQYMSASTIKPLTALAALNYGIMTPDSVVTCTGYWTGLGEAYGQYCWDHSGHGPMNLQSAITWSCDPMFYEIGKGFYYSDGNTDGMQQTYREWGLGEATGVDLGGESTGRVPDAAWKKEAFSSYSSDDQAWNPGDMTNLAIGQGDILVTPLQMAMVYCGLANGGVQMVPHLLKSVVARDGEGDALSYEAKERLRVEEDSSYMDLVHQGLQGVIYEESASTAAHFSNIYQDGQQVILAGKSGTGEKIGEDEYGWFIAYAPYDDPQYVVACLCEQAGFGANSAMYAVREVFGAIYDSPDDSTVVASDGAR